VVNALVDATPISGPARVINTRSDSLTNELSGTLADRYEYFAPASWLPVMPPVLSAVSPVANSNNQGIRRKYRTSVAKFTGYFDVARTWASSSNQ